MAELQVDVRDRVGQVGLRADPRDEAGMTAVAELLGTRPPHEPNTWRQGREHAALWLGPDEWLVVGGTPEGASRLAGALEALPAAALVSAVDLSANRVIVECSGAAVYDVLARGCTLDLHPRSFAPGWCAQTRLGQAQIIIQHLDASPPCLRLYVRRSFVAYVRAWLGDAVTTR